MGTSKFNAGGNPASDYHPIQRRAEILIVVSCYRNYNKLQPNGLLGLYADFALPFTVDLFVFLEFLKLTINK